MTAGIVGAHQAVHHFDGLEDHNRVIKEFTHDPDYGTGSHATQSHVDVGRSHSQSTGRRSVMINDARQPYISEGQRSEGRRPSNASLIGLPDRPSMSQMSTSSGAVKDSNLGGSNDDVTRNSSVSAADWEVVMRSSGLVNQESLKDNSWIDGDRFQFCIGTIICLNVIVIGIETDLNDRNADFRALTPWKMVEIFFCWIWVAESLLRLYFERCRYFVGGWNMVDIVLVISSITELFILPYIVGQEVLPAFFRAIRILRLLRLLRLVRLVPFFKDLWLIICGFVEALKTLGWVLLLMVVIIYSGGIYMTILVGHSCDGDYTSWGDCKDVFGTVPGSMYSLFQVLTLESWSMLIARPVLKKKPYLVAFFLSFMMLTTFGLLNIIVGVIVENTLKASNDEMNRAMMERDAKMRIELLGLREVFEEADEDHNGNVDMEEFTSIFSNPEVQQRLAHLDIPCDNPESLFEMFDEDGGGTLTIFEFVEGASRLKSAPKPTEMRSAAHQVFNTSQTIGKMKVTIGQMGQALGMQDIAAQAKLRRGLSAQAFTRQTSPAESLQARKEKRRRSRDQRTLESIKPALLEVNVQDEDPIKPDDLHSRKDSSRSSSPLGRSLKPDSPIVLPRETSNSGSGELGPANPRALDPQLAPVWDHPRTLASHSANRARLEGIEWSVGQRLQRLERIAHNLARSQDKVKHAVNQVLTRIPQAVPDG